MMFRVKKGLKVESQQKVLGTLHPRKIAALNAEMPHIQPFQSLIDEKIAVLEIPSNGKPVLTLVNPEGFAFTFEVQKEVPTGDDVTPADSTAKPWKDMSDILYSAKDKVENVLSTKKQAKAAALEVRTTRTGLRHLPQSQKVGLEICTTLSS
jgi:hypothetical protein